MTDNQYKRFKNIVSSLHNNFKKKKNIIKTKVILVTLTDSKDKKIRFKIKKNIHLTEKGLVHLICNKLDELKKIGEKLDLDHQCNLSIKIVNKVKTDNKKSFKK